MPESTGRKEQRRELAEDRLMNGTMSASMSSVTVTPMYPRTFAAYLRSTFVSFLVATLNRASA